MNYSYSINEKSYEASLGTKICLYILGIAVGIVPLVMRAVIEKTYLSEFSWFNIGDESIDIFLASKGNLLVITAVAMFIILLCKLFIEHKKIELSLWFFPLVGYVALTIISTIVSPYRDYGLRGIYEQHESLFVIISYCILLVYAYVFTKTEYGIHFVKSTLGFLAVVHSFIGITQLVGADFFASKLGRILMIPGSIEDAESIRESLSFTFSGSGNHQVYLTLYNPNYVGSYSALLFPIFVVVSIFSKKKTGKIFWGILALINFLCAMGSGSKTFLGAFLVSFILALIFFRKKLKSGWKVLLGLSLVLVISGFAYFSYVGQSLFDYLSKALAYNENNYKLERVDLEDDRAIISYNGVRFSLQYEPMGNTASIVFKDEAGLELPYKLDEGNVNLRIDDERLSDLYFEYLKTSEEPARYLINCNTPRGDFSIIKTEEGYKYYVGVGKTDDINYPEIAVIKNHDSFASGRGYIWSRTFPILFKHLLIGTGADTFAIFFPQNDYIGRLNGGFNHMLITKPHNLYLQIGVQSGGLALICFIMLAVIYIVQVFKIFFNRDIKTTVEVFGIGIFLGIVGYLFTGIMNDSCVATAPLYFGLLGTGFGINSYLIALKKSEI